MSLARMRRRLQEDPGLNRYYRDWKFNYPSEAVTAVVNGFTNDNQNGAKFVQEAVTSESCSNFPHYYAELREIFNRALANYVAGVYNCPRCFDAGRVVRFGRGCCGREYCTDIVNAHDYKCTCAGGDAGDDRVDDPVDVEEVSEAAPGDISNDEDV